MKLDLHNFYSYVFSCVPAYLSLFFLKLANGYSALAHSCNLGKQKRIETLLVLRRKASALYIFLRQQVIRIRDHSQNTKL